MVASDFALWPIAPFGAENDGDDDSSSDNSGQSNSQDSQQNPPPAPKPKPGPRAPQNVGDDDDDEFEGLSQKDLKRRLNEETAARKRVEGEKRSLEAEQENSRRAKRSKEENLQKDLEASQAREAHKDSVIARLAIVNAILNNAEFSWHNAEVVAQQFNPGDVTVDENGNVSGLKKALPKVAEEHPYLLKERQPKQQDNNGKPPVPNVMPFGVTGQQPGQGGANSGGLQSPSVEELAKDYTALHSRR